MGLSVGDALAAMPRATIRVPRWQITTAAMLVGAALTWMLVVHRPLPEADQLTLLGASWTGSGPFPAPMRGAFSEAIAATVGLFASGHTQDVVLQMLMASAALAATAALASTVTRSTWAPAVTVALVATSPMVTVWVTSELVVAAALMWALVAAARGPSWLVGVCCALVALAKPDAALIAVVLAGWFGWQRHDWRVPATFAGAVAVAVLPGTLLVDGYWRYTEDLSRSWIAFGQHFANAVGVQALPVGPSPWAGWQFYTDRLLPGADSLTDVVRLHPGQYLRFVGRSVVLAAGNAMGLFGPLLLVTAWIARHTRRLGRVGVGALLTLMGLLPNVLIAFPQTRHLMRWYPLAAVAVMVMFERSGRRGRAGAAMVAVGALAWNLLV